MRMREGATSAPKPMSMIGDRPLLWHVMRYYAHFGHTDFVLCLGYGAAAVKDYFLRYDETLVQRLHADRRRPRGEAAQHRHHRLEHHLHRHRAHSSIGERLMRVRQHVRGRGDVPRQLRRHAHRRPADEMIERVREQSDAAASMLAVPPVVHPPRGRDGRRRPGHRRPRGARADAVGERRLLRHAAGRSSTSCARARTWCRTPSTGC